MQNCERMLTIDDAYDAVVDYLEKLYNKTKSGDVGSLASEMSLFADGKSADPAAQKDWTRSVDKILDSNSSNRKNFELSGNKLNIEQAYDAMIDFLDGYRGRITSADVAAILQDMKLITAGTSADPVAWNNWVESVDKILTQNPRIRPLLFGVNTKILTIEDTYDTVIDCLNKYSNKTQLNDLKMLLKSMELLDNGEATDPIVWNEWNNAVTVILKKNSESFEDGLDTTQAYEVMTNFLDTYGQRVNSSEIITMLDGIKLLDEQESKDPIAWLLWIESINKALNKYRTF